MDRRSFIKGLIALASAPAIGKYVNIFKTEGAREGIEQVASQGVDFFNMVIKKVMDEGTLVKEEDRISTFKHPDRPDITVDVDQTTGSSSVYFDTDEGTKAVGEIQKTMDETTKGRTVEELFEQEEIYGPTGRDAQEGISGGITNLEEFIKMKRGFAAGGRVGMFRGGVPKGLQAAMRAIMSKYGDDAITTADRAPQPPKTTQEEIMDFQTRNPDPNRPLTDAEIKDYEMELGDSETWMMDGTVGEAEKALIDRKEYMADIMKMKERGDFGDFSPSKLNNVNDDQLAAAVDNIFPSGDIKLDAEMAAESLVELNPQIFGDVLYEDLPDKLRSDIYGAVLEVLSGNSAKMRELKKLSKPTNTLASMKAGKGINMSDPNIADEFTRFMKESDPGGYKDIEEKILLESFDPKKTKGNANGGIIGLTTNSRSANSKAGVESLFKRR